MQSRPLYFSFLTRQGRDNGRNEEVGSGAQIHFRPDEESTVLSVSNPSCWIFDRTSSGAIEFHRKGEINMSSLI